MAFHSELHQAPGIRVNGAFAELQGIHFTQALEPGFGYFAAFLLRRNALMDTFAFFVIQGIEFFFAHIDPEQGRHGHEDVTGFNQGGKMLQKQR